MSMSIPILESFFLKYASKKSDNKIKLFFFINKKTEDSPYISKLSFLTFFFSFVALIKKNNICISLAILYCIE